MDITIKVEGAEAVAKEFALRPKQIERASRLTVNQITKELHKELGGQIPKTAGSSIPGYRKHRAKKRLAKAKDKKKIRGVVWLGTKSIAAKYIKGRPGHIAGYGASKGKYVFKNSFWKTMKNGYKSIFRRTKRTKSGIEEERVSLPKSHAESLAALRGKRRTIQNILEAQLRKLFEKGKKK